MSRNYLILLALMIITSLLFFFLSSSTIDSKLNKIEKYDNRIKIEQEKLNSAKVLNRELQEVSKVIYNSMIEKKERNPDEVNMFIKRLADLADKYQIAVHSLFPKISDTSRRFIEQQYIMELNCSFVQLGKFLTDLESFDYIIKINTFEVQPLTSEKLISNIEETVTRYKVILELSTFKIIKEA